MGAELIHSGSKAAEAMKIVRFGAPQVIVLDPNSRICSRLKTCSFTFVFQNDLVPRMLGNYGLEKVIREVGTGIEEALLTLPARALRLALSAWIQNFSKILLDLSETAQKKLNDESDDRFRYGEVGKIVIVFRDPDKSPSKKLAFDEIAPIDEIGSLIGDHGIKNYVDIVATGARHLSRLNPPQIKDKYSILVWGETGVGKSAICNLIGNVWEGNLIGGFRKPFISGSDATGVTFQTTYRTFHKADGKQLTVYDTAGLNEGDRGSSRNETAEGNLISLVEQVHKTGLSAMIMVVNAERIKDSHLPNYKIVASKEGFDFKAPKYLLVNCRGAGDRPDWLEQKGLVKSKPNKELFDDQGLKFDEHYTTSAGMMADAYPDDLGPTLLKMAENAFSKKIPDMLELLEPCVPHEPKDPSWYGGWFVNVFNSIWKLDFFKPKSRL
jgi:hypothetical protein